MSTFYRKQRQVSRDKKHRGKLSHKERNCKASRPYGQSFGEALLLQKHYDRGKAGNKQGKNTVLETCPDIFLTQILAYIK